MTAICVICKVDLENISELVFQCPNCKREYIGDYEIMSYEEEIGTAHDEEAATIELEGIAGINTPRLETKNDELSEIKSEAEELETKKSKSDIKIPKYMTNSETTKVVDYEEK